MSEKVRNFLRERGSPERVVERGLDGLVADWERTVDEVAAGYALGLDDYLNDLDGRQLIAEVLAATGNEVSAPTAARLGVADDRMQALSSPTGRCLWGDDNAVREGWDAEHSWWYFRAPRLAGPELEADLRRRGGGGLC